MEHAADGSVRRRHPVAGAAGMAGRRRQATSAQDLHAQSRPAVRRAGDRCGRALPRPARQRAGPLGRREDADSGARPDPSGCCPCGPGPSSAATATTSDTGPRICMRPFNIATGEVWTDHPAPSRHRVPPVPRADRSRHAGRPRAAPHRRQQQYAYDPSDSGLPGHPFPLSPAFYAHQRVVAQCGRDLVRPVGAARPVAWHLHQCDRAARSHSPRHRDAQHPRRQALPMDQVSPHHSRRRGPCQRSPAQRHFPHGTLAPVTRGALFECSDYN